MSFRQPVSLERRGGARKHYYPKDPEFKKKYRAARRLKSKRRSGRQSPRHWPDDTEADEDERRRVPGGCGLDFLERGKGRQQAVLLWFNSTRMHVWTHLKKEWDSKTGIGLYPDGMVEHDGHVGQLLRSSMTSASPRTPYRVLDGQRCRSRDLARGGTTPFDGEKGTTWEGGIPGAVRQALARGHQAQEPWSTTSAPITTACRPSRRRRRSQSRQAALRKGNRQDGKNFKVHLDGHSQLPFFKGEEKRSARRLPLLER